MGKREKVVIAMSGGVDSSVAAALLVEQGYDVIGMMLRLWSEPGSEETNRCCTPLAMDAAKKTARILDIPFYAVDVKNVFKEAIVDYFISGYAAGVTPNPCLQCNQKIRWGFLFDRAKVYGANYFSTGHYARIEETKQGTYKLLKGADQSKDQSYVLSILNQSNLSKTILPLGDFTKEEVRQLSKKFNLPSSESKDSQDLCFIGGGSYQDFLERNAPNINNKGEIQDINGQIVGVHNGIANYTIGQRKGLGVPSHAPLYVVSKNKAKNTIVVGNKNNLYISYALIEKVNWIAGNPLENQIECEVKTRYTANPVSATIIPKNESMVGISFHEPTLSVTPGQGATFYSGNEVLGGGIIVNTIDKHSSEASSYDKVSA